MAACSPSAPAGTQCSRQPQSPPLAGLRRSRSLSGRVGMNPTSPCCLPRATNTSCGERSSRLERAQANLALESVIMTFLMQGENPSGSALPDAPIGSLLLGEQLCFALYAASRSVTQLYRPLLEELGLTYPQYLVMLVLWERSATLVRDLADLRQLDSGTLSPLLKRLQAAGLLERRRR